MMKMFEGELLENRVIIWDKEARSLYEEYGYGKPEDDYLELSLVEAAYLMKKRKLKVFVKEDGRKKWLKFNDFYRIAVKVEPEFHQKFIVYSDLRKRGFVVKTGFKFGAHFRVYEKGVRIKRGPKAPFEHTKWVVHAIKEEDRFSYPELSRAVRLAQNIRAKMLWAVVDSENDVTYYQVTRIKL